ncbi:MAG: glycosyl hydrolase [Bacteroidota bacterium]|nr:glycosyl hydrolase [Bacteroidota bacterium]
MKILKSIIILTALTLSVAMPQANAQKKKGKKADKEEKAKDPLADVSLSSFKFRGIGPALTSGRISDLAVNPDNISEFYVAAAAGGVWKTTNSGLTFDPVFDNEGSYSIGCVTIDPNNSNVVWVGTGENNNQRSVSYGDGVYKSVDGGKSWKNMGLKESEHIGMIIVDPRCSETIYVAAYGPVWSAGGDRGVYKSTDSGESWKKVLEISEHTGVNEVHFDPRDPDVIYATAHQRRRRQWTYLGGGPESGIYKSTDAGSNWKKINKGLPGGDKGRIGMDISPADPEIIYACVEGPGGGFYKSTNRGASWNKMSSTTTSGNYYQEVIADPVDPDRVFIMNTYTLVSVDGGKTFTNRGEASKHIDNHCLWINPDNPMHHREGSDGGLYETYDNGKTWRYFTNLPVTQFYKVGVDNDYPFYNVMGGTQDNYSMVGPSQTLSAHGIVSADWPVTVTGDGFESVADPKDPNIIYAQSQHGNLVRFDKKSGESRMIQPAELMNEKAYNWNWDSPVLVSPHDNKTLYFASNKVFKTSDRGDSWTVISGDLDQNIDRNLLPIMGKVWPMDAVSKNGSTSRYGAVVSLDESRIKAGLVYAGTDDGQISVTEDDGKNWRQVNSFDGVPENTYVYDLIAGKHDVNVVFAAFNNHKSGDFTPYVYKSVDKGSTWTNISSDLPEGAIYALEQDHVNSQILFAGTEYGVYVTLNGGEAWKRLKAGLPTINVRDMAIQERENDLVLATFGRGLYILDNYSALRELTPELPGKDAHIFAIKETRMFNRWRPLGGLGSRQKGFQGEDYFSAPNPEYGVVIKYWVKEGVTTLKAERQKAEKKKFKDGEVFGYPTLEQWKAEKDELPSYLIFTITDENGEFVRELRTGLKKGLNKITWDMQYPSTFSVSARDASETKGLSSSGIEVVPGTYKVSMAKNEKGVLTELVGFVEFEIKPLNNITLPAKDRNELLAFKKKAIELSGVIGAVSGSLLEMQTKIAPWKAATKVFRGQEAADLFAEVRDLEDKLKEIQVMLSGDRDLRSLDMDADVGLRSRAGTALYGLYGNFSEIPGSARQQYKIASELFTPIYNKTKALIKDFEAMDEKMGDVGAPLTPGRLPDWK